jgi:hypothetical protein
MGFEGQKSTVHPALYGGPIWECPNLSVVDQFGTKRYHGAGNIVLSDDGHLTITVECPAELDGREYRLSGNTEDGAVVTIDRCVMEKTRVTPSHAECSFLPFHCQITNPCTRSDAWTRRALVVKNIKLRTQQTWLDGSREFLLEPLDGLQSGRGKLTVVNPATTDDFAEQTSDILSLLRFAYRSNCSVPREDVFNEDGWIQTSLVPCHHNENPTNLLIPWNMLGDFMAQVAPVYHTFRDAYGLDLISQYYCRSYSETVLELKFLFASVLMETLKFYWTKNVARLPADIKSNGMIRAFLKPNGRSYTFQELIEMTATHIGVTAVYTFVDDRNAMFHTGQPTNMQSGASDTWNYLQPELRKLHDQVDDLILTLLKYSGPIASFWDPNHIVDFPGRSSHQGSAAMW